MQTVNKQRALAARRRWGMAAEICNERVNDCAVCASAPRAPEAPFGDDGVEGKLEQRVDHAQAAKLVRQHAVRIRQIETKRRALPHCRARKSSGQVQRAITISHSHARLSASFFAAFTLRKEQHDCERCRRAHVSILTALACQFGSAALSV